MICGVPSVTVEDLISGGQLTPNLLVKIDTRNDGSLRVHCVMTGRHEMSDAAARRERASRGTRSVLRGSVTATLLRLSWGRVPALSTELEAVRNWPSSSRSSRPDSYYSFDAADRGRLTAGEVSSFVQNVKINDMAVPYVLSKLSTGLRPNQIRLPPRPAPALAA